MERLATYNSAEIAKLKKDMEEFNAKMLARIKELEG
jgi:hypothetical protein